MRKPKLITKVEGQIDLMDGLTQVNKKDFVEIFCDKYKTSKKLVSAELAAINRDYGIGNYHNKGFIFSWGKIVSEGVNWGTFASSFNIDNPLDMVTVGYDPIKYSTPDRAIHCNIYRKPTTLQLPSVKDRYIMRICFYGRQDIEIANFTKMGLLYSVLQIGKNMFLNNQKGDGLWHNFLFRKCKICDEQVNNEQDVCASCLVE